MGSGLTLGQFILLFFVGKAINSMWLLILAVQFIAYMTQWQINFNDSTRTFATELKKLALAEYFDDFEFSTKLKKLVGLPAEDN